jgi:hypothetical protein
MTTITEDEMASPVLCNQVLDALMSATPAQRAMFESHVEAAKAGTLPRVRAFGICRQLRGGEAPAMGEDQIKMPRSTGNATSTRSNDASEAQARFAADLLRTRVLADERVVGTVKTAAELLAAYDESGRMNRSLARNVIDTYKDRPRVFQPAPVAPSAPQAAAKPAAKAEPVTLEPGIYQVDEAIYKVQKSRQSGRLYAQKLVDGRWDYDAGWGAMKFLRPEHRMTTEQAAAFGQKFGMCVNGHPLSDRTSRYFGYGESCANRNGWTYDKHLVPADFE